MERLKRFFNNVFCAMASIGLIDMATQAWTNGNIKPIHIVLEFLFPVK